MNNFDTFGNIISDSNEDFSLPFRFAGGIYDEDTNLLRFGARDYDPEVGRWTAKEPLGFDGSRNFYVYSKNNPVNLLDITGLKPGDPFATADEAAKDAMEYIYEDSTDIGVEFGGIIVLGQDDCYYATMPIMGNSTSVPIVYPSGLNAVGWYHSHPEYNTEGNLLFSDGNAGDLGITSDGNDAYLVNPLGDMLKYDSSESKVEKIGHIGNKKGKDSDYYDATVGNNKKQYKALDYGTIEF